MVKNDQINTTAILSLIMGILSILLFPFIGWVFGVIGLLYSNRSLQQIKSTEERGQNLAIAGKVCSTVGITLSVVSIIIGVLGFVLFTYRQGY